jgi:ribulose bisphosphate carboxylase small subunit
MSTEAATSKQITKQVRAIIKKHYEYWSTFNDARADKKTSRIKCMRNG